MSGKFVERIHPFYLTVFACFFSRYPRARFSQKPLKTKKKNVNNNVKNLRGTLTNQSFKKLSMEVQDQTKNGL